MRRMESKWIEQLKRTIRARNYSIRTEQAYVQWLRRFVIYHDGREPVDMHDEEVVAFLTWLAVKRNVSANTQNQALNALAFFYKHVTRRPLGDITAAARAKKPQKLPMVLSRDQVRQVLMHLDGTYRTIGALLYGSGLRLKECLDLRIKDIDFNYQCIHVHDGKGAKDRIVQLPSVLNGPLKRHLHDTRLVYERDIAKGGGEVYLPPAIGRKYPNACREWKWQFVFPASRIGRDSRSGKRRRHHIHPTAFQKAIHTAVLNADIDKPASAHTLRHSFATHALEDGMDIRTLQQQMGHASLETTEIYTHVLKRGGHAVRSPLEDIFPSEDPVDE